MAIIPGAVPVAGFIGPTDDTDVYAVIDPIYGIDGLRSVANLTERDNITTERRRHGMLVFVRSNSNYYQLESDLTSWVDLGPTLGGGNVGSGTIATTLNYEHVLGQTVDFKAKKLILSLTTASKSYAEEILISKDHTDTLVPGYSLVRYTVIGDILADIELDISGPDLVLRITNNELVTLTYTILNDVISVGGSAHIIEDEGSPLPQRDTINFVGPGVTVTDAGSKTVVTITSGGDVVGPVSSVDNILVRFDGITGKLIQESGISISDADDITNVNSLSVSGRTSTNDLQLTSTNTLPSTPSEGDIYFDSDYKCLMFYDASRSKWLSSDSYTFTLSSNDAIIAAGVSLRISTTPTSITPVFLGPDNTCLVGIMVSTAEAEDFTLAVNDVVVGTNVYSYVIPSGTLYSNLTLNDDFDAGNAIDVFIGSLGSSGNINRPTVTLIYRRRK